MRRAPTTLALALFLLGCAPASEPVSLATGPGELPEGPDGQVACITFFNVGVLTADQNYGTAAIDQGGTHPLIWPLGYTARRLAGSLAIEVLDRSGDVVATTGRRYQFWTGNWEGSGTGPVHTGGPGCVNPYVEGPTAPPYKPQVIEHFDTLIGDRY